MLGFSERAPLINLLSPTSIQISARMRTACSPWPLSAVSFGQPLDVSNVLHSCIVPSFSDQGKIPTPAFHTFTGTEFTTPEVMHGALWRAVKGEKDEEGTNIEKKLSAKLKYRHKTPTVTSPMLVVVLDEIDQLMTQNRQVLRKLFEWADAPKSRLVSHAPKHFGRRSRFIFPSAKECV